MHGRSCHGSRCFIVRLPHCSSASTRARKFVNDRLGMRWGRVTIYHVPSTGFEVGIAQPCWCPGSACLSGDLLILSYWDALEKNVLPDERATKTWVACGVNGRRVSFCYKSRRLLQYTCTCRKREGYFTYGPLYQVCSGSSLAGFTSTPAASPRRQCHSCR